MSGRPPPRQEENSVKEKLLGIFRRNKPLSQNAPRPAAKDFIITPQILKDIGPESPSNNRMRNIKSLADVVKEKKLEENAPEALWCAIRDLVEPRIDTELRHQALRFLLALIEGQLKFLGIMRGYFFHVIEGLENAEDLSLRLDLFRVLSCDGKNLLEFEEETAPFLLKVMPDALTSGLISEFLQLLIRVIKYNAAYIDEDIMCGLVQQTCMIQNRSRSEEDTALCISAMDAVICYSYLPPDSLQYLVAALCHIVNKPNTCNQAWDLTKKLLVTHLAHKTIFTLCCMMQDKQHAPDFLLLRGAVFIVATALWGSRRIATLKQTPGAVLPSFYQVLEYEDPKVALEVSLAIMRLVSKFGKDLLHVAWNSVLDILLELLRQVEKIPNIEPSMVVNIHEALTHIEALHQSGHFLGPEKRIFSIIEACSNKRPVESVCRLIDHHLQEIHPRQDNWIQNLYHLLDKFYRQETRTEVRRKMLEKLNFVLAINKHVYEVDMIDCLLIPHFSHIDVDPDVEVRKMVVDIVMSMAQGCCKDEFFDLVSITEKLLRRPLLMPVLVRNIQTASDVEIEFPPVYVSEQNQEDVKLAFNKVIEAFKHKLYTAPPSHALRLFNLIVSHLEMHYTQGYNTAIAAVIRKAGLELLLQLRADEKHRVGIANRSGVTGCSFSAYVLCTTSVVEHHIPASPIAPNVPISSMFIAVKYAPVLSLFSQCLKLEKDWQVLKTLLCGLPSVLENKTLLLAAEGTWVYTICGQLCTMVSERNMDYIKNLQSVPEGFKISDFHNCVLPVLSAMVAYHPYMDKNRQLEMMKCFEFGLVTGVAKVCVNSLRICCLEMQDQMVRVLPSVLISLSKISATVSMAIPVLAFLSSIVRLPKLYVNFNNGQYLSVFAIALPYTNPFKFSHYTVSLAHHVINIWFIRCRLGFRKDFVKYIVRHLSSYIQRLLKESQLEHQHRLEQQQCLDQLNESSVLRSRSGSEGTTSRRRMLSGPASLRREHPLPMDEKMTQFHKELMETAIDSLAWYTCGNMTNSHQRTPMTEFLLKDGPSDTWLVGNKLITITTSGGGVKEPGSMFCSKCLELLQQSKQGKQAQPEKRRRHKSAILLSRSISEIAESASTFASVSPEDKHQTRDDLSLLYESGCDDAAVQTGSSLSSGYDIETLGSMLMSWKTQTEERSKWTARPCPCWCSGWAEVLIRSASGNVAWVMRTENQCPVGGFSSDPSIPDIALLFSPIRSPDTDTASKLDSGSLKEEDYDSVHAEIFSWDSRSQQSQSEHSEHDKLTLPSEAIGEELSPASSLCKTNSVPSLLSSSADDVIDSKGELSVMKQLPPFGSDNTDMTRSTVRRPVQIMVESSESRSMPAAENFEGLEKNKAEESDEIREGATMILNSREESKGLPHNPIGETVDGVGQAGLGDFVKPAAADSSREQTRTGSKLQIQLKEYDLEQQAKKEQKKESVESTNTIQPPKTLATVRSPQSPSKPPVKFLPSPVNSGGATGRFGLAGDSHHLSLHSSDSSSSSSAAHEGQRLLELRMKNKRGHTISVMSPAEATRQHEEASLRAVAGGKDALGVVTPAQVFLQLYHNQQLIGDSQDLPLKVPSNEAFQRSLKLLDNIFPYETHNIGVIYVGPGQVRDEKAIFGNRYGSVRYTEFIQGLGHIVPLPGPEQDAKIYTGSLTTENGKFAYTWQDESMHVIFHIATLMPNKKGDESYVSKKLHVGNDFVTIVYNDSGEEFKLGTLSGQYNYVNIVIRPLDHGGNAVTLLAKQDYFLDYISAESFMDHISADIAESLGHTHPKIISDTNLALLVRQIAVHCNLASLVLKAQKFGHQPFASNCLERLRAIKRIRTRVTEHHNATGATTGKNYGTGGNTGAISPTNTKMFVIEDFTDYL